MPSTPAHSLPTDASRSQLPQAPAAPPEKDSDDEFEELMAKVCLRSPVSAPAECEKATLAMLCPGSVFKLGMCPCSAECWVPTPPS